MACKGFGVRIPVPPLFESPYCLRLLVSMRRPSESDSDFSSEDVRVDNDGRCVMQQRAWERPVRLRQVEGSCRAHPMHVAKR
jgi:hypothetical protein